ncbi:hypothetical protein [Paracoccus litorisediminis]|uniref:Uncharacterized protein n=1 Tax=Paracoccus litorisediminis TaxID=2006130 RepID=A0A844HUE0_9RHOB|nr:hypothetical protein [Paracoccus litorisediminis]MTH61191.1 hypothetical protein [Paracoccus litorisediminis]
MGIVLREAGQGAFLSATEIYPHLSYAAEVTLGALRKSIEFLEKQQLVIRERQGRRVVIVPTERGYNWFRPAAPSSAGPSTS